MNLESCAKKPCKVCKVFGIQDSRYWGKLVEESSISNLGNFTSLQTVWHTMCRSDHHPEVYLKPGEETQHSHDFKIRRKQVSAWTLKIFVQATSSNMPWEAISFQKWHWLHNEA